MGRPPLFGKRSVAQAGAVKAINRMQTIGYYVAEFELKGRERAEYGDKLFAKLAERVAVKRLVSGDSYIVTFFLQILSTDVLSSRNSVAEVREEL